MKSNLNLVLAFALVARAASTNAQTLDSFNPACNGDVSALAVQPDGKIWIGGTFSAMNGEASHGLARVSTDGTLDLAFDPGAATDDFTYSPQVIAMVVQPDGKVVAGGWFTSFDGEPRVNIVRVNTNGIVDPDFNPDYTSGLITSMTMQPDGKILVISGFNIFRINTDGSRDTTFNVSTSGSIATYLAIQTDGKILVLGGVNLVISNVVYSVNGLGRIGSNGAYDASFNYFGSLANNSGVPTALTIQPDGKVVVGNYVPHYVLCGPGGGLCLAYFDILLTRITSNGAFETDVASIHHTLAASGLINVLTMQANGKFIAGSSPISRVMSSGGVDLNFSTTATANVLALQSDGRLVFGGPVGRIINNEPATQSLSYSNSTITWMRGGSSPEVWRTTFEYSTDRGTNWTSIGAGTRINGGWQRAGVSLPFAGTIRARGYIVAGDSSSWFVEKLLITEPLKLVADEANYGISSNQFRFHLSGYPGTVAVIEGSTNLIDWTPLITNTLSSSPLPFSDPAFISFPRRFYRARTQ